MLERLFGEELENLGIKIPFNKLLFIAVSLSALISLLIFYLVEIEGPLKGFVVIAILILPSSLLYFLLDYFKDAKRRKIEGELPQALFQMASFPERAPMELLLRNASEWKSALGMEFSKADKLISAGFSTDAALDALHSSSGSMLFKRSVSLLQQSYRAGGGNMKALSEIAESISEMQLLQRENSAALAMQKYTLLAAVAIFIPLIAGVLLSLSASLSANADEIMFFGNANPMLIPALDAALQIYLFLLSAISSAFLAMQEGKLKKAPLYFCIMFASAALIFNISKSYPLA